MAGQSEVADQLLRDQVLASEGMSLGLGVGVMVLVVGLGVIVPLATTGDDAEWTPQERAVAAPARARAEDMLSGNAFQPTVTVAFSVEVLAGPETVDPSTRARGVCRPEMPDRAALAHVEAQTLFGITLWTYEITCNSASLLGGI